MAGHEWDWRVCLRNCTRTSSLAAITDLLIAALPNPLGRFMMLHGLFERFRLPGKDIVFAGPREFVDEKDAARAYAGRVPSGMRPPVWVYDVAGRRIEKRLLLPYKQNTVYIEYRYVMVPQPSPGVSGRRFTFAITTRRSTQKSTPNMFSAPPDYRSGDIGRIRLATSAHDDHPAVRVYVRTQNRDHRLPLREEPRLSRRGILWSPGYFRADLEPGSPRS